MQSMPVVVDTVNMPYHHGHLREALIDAALDAARSEGPSAVGLRAATRAVEVSHNAAYRHFEDRDALLQAVCHRCMAEMAALMEARCAELPRSADPVVAAWERLEATGRAYVEFALSEPGWFRTAFAVPTGLDFVDRVSVPHDPYQLLVDCLDGLVEVGALSAERRQGAEVAAWSAVHGLAMLILDGPLRALPPAERHRALGIVVRSVAEGL